MARRRTPLEPPPVEVCQFSGSEIHRGITKLRRRIEEVKNLDPRQIRYDDGKNDNVAGNIRETIREVFGPDPQSSTITSIIGSGTADTA